MEARQPISFFIHLLEEFWTSDDALLDNVTTNEKLVIKGATHQRGRVAISRYPTGAAEEWIEEMAKYEDEKDHNRIIVIRF
jgi:hypothetical protein